MFTKNKVFAYENSDGDKGIIIAKSIEEAKKIFHEKYPERKIVDNYYDYCQNEMDLKRELFPLRMTMQVV